MASWNERVIELLESISGGGGGQPSEVEVTNFPADQTVSGSVGLTGAASANLAAIAVALGAPDDEPWDGEADTASVIAVLKAIFLQGEPE